MTRCSIDRNRNLLDSRRTKQSGISFAPPTGPSCYCCFDAPPLSRFIYLLSSIQLNSITSFTGTPTGGQAKRFRELPPAHTPRSRYRYCIGISCPGRRGRQVFYGTGTKNRSNPKSIQYHLSQRNVLEWRQGFTGRYQWVGWLKQPSQARRIQLGLKRG